VVADELVKHGFASRPSPKKTATVMIPAGEETDEELFE
jgi:hypothetical protein